MMDAYRTIAGKTDAAIITVVLIESWTLSMWRNLPWAYRLCIDPKIGSFIPFLRKKTLDTIEEIKRGKKKRTIEILKIKLVYCFSILLAMFLAMPFVLLCMARKKEEEKVLSALSYRTKSTVRIYLSFNSGRFSFVHSLRNNDNKK